MQGRQNLKEDLKQKVDEITLKIEETQNLGFEMSQKQEKINLIMNVDDYKNEENPFAFLRDRILTLSDEELKDTINKALKKENILEQSLRKEEVLKSFEKRYFNY